jgi:SAM-dependent methyltransferase
MVRVRELPYIVFRVIRHFLPTAVFRSLTKALPWMQRSVGETSGERLANWYHRFFAAASPPISVAGARLLELGTGATNAACYEFVGNQALFCHSYEPFIALDRKIDSVLLSDCSRRHGLPPDFIRARTSRVSSLETLEPDSVDLILSNSVLEHVIDLAALNRQLVRILRPGGWMIHIVDYRDHFSAYPYHHLIWSRRTWDRWFNPGDLPRWRITDHVQAFENLGLKVQIIVARSYPEAFDEIRDRVHPEFTGYPEDQLSVAWGVIQVQKPSGATAYA